eukprot:5169270-Pyramimonas_sp.AAC.1
MYGRAQRDPLSLPALVFDSAQCKSILKVKGAIDYSTEVTCVVILKEESRATLMSAVLPAGVFLTEQQSKKVPRFVKQKDDEDPKVYYRRVRALADGQAA